MIGTALVGTKVAIAPSTRTVRAAARSVAGKASTFRGARVQGVARSAKATRRAVAAQAKLGQQLEEFLLDSVKDSDLRQVMMSMAEASRTIAHKVRTASCEAQGCVNSFGDEQLAVDLLADKILFESLKYSGACAAACSEEVPVPVPMTKGAKYAVAFDPLDGSSIVDTNFAVGTIFGIYDKGDALKDVTGRDLAGAGITQYGPRTTLCIAFKGVPGTHEFLLMDDGKWIHVKETMNIGTGKMFSPGNLRATFDNPAYEKLINFYIGEKYTLRYTGGMVPDVFQIIVKEKGVFTNVDSPSTKCKLRILFEVAPIALLVENAGGASSIGGVSALDVPITDYDQRTGIIYGSVEEVKRAEDFLYGKSTRFAGAA
jgi:sedoheptulose-bisphosphatase